MIVLRVIGGVIALTLLSITTLAVVASMYVQQFVFGKINQNDKL